MAGNRIIHTFRTEILLLLFSVFIVSAAKAQGFPENPPIPVKVEVRNTRFLNFGSFTTGVTGGTVTVDQHGMRSATGDVFLLNLGSPSISALFDVTANPGTLITITIPSNFKLHGDGGNGGEIELEINSNLISPGQYFISTAIPPMTNEVEVGGTLHIGNEAQNPAGYYSGTFSLIFNYE